jgi:hypothetical protein
MIINMLCRSFFGYERSSSFRGVREFRFAPVDQKRTKKIKAPIPLFKNLHERQAWWASSLWSQPNSLGLSFLFLALVIEAG